MASFHVIITRITDSSVRHVQGGGRSEVGKVTASRTFRDAGEARREADAWNHAGEFAHYGPSDWTAEVKPGPAPETPCGVKVCTVLTEHRHMAGR